MASVMKSIFTAIDEKPKVLRSDQGMNLKIKMLKNNSKKTELSKFYLFDREYSEKWSGEIFTIIETKMIMK